MPSMPFASSSQPLGHSQHFEVQVDNLINLIVSSNHELGIFCRNLEELLFFFADEHPFGPAILISTQECQGRQGAIPKDPEC